VDERIVLQIYVAWSRGHGKIKSKLLIGCIKTLNWLVNNYSLLGLKTKHTPLLQ